MTETLNGFIERVTYHNPENGFAVLKVKVKGRQDLVTVVGNTTSVTAGEHFEASGRWLIDRQHGQQFKAEELKTTHPASAEGIEKYLSSGAIRSIGPKLAEKIVSVYKERTLDIFENYSELLLHIKGIGTERLKRIRQSWEEQKEVRKIFEEHWLRKFPLPETVLTDNGKQFLSKSFKNLLLNFNRKYKKTLPYNPRGNAII